MFVKKGKKWRNPRTIGNEKGKTLLTILGLKSIAVPDVKSYILWHYCINMKIREKRRMKHSSIDQAP